MIPRLVACLHGQRPHIVPPPPSWQKWLAHLVQFVLYVLLFAVPLLGIANRLWSPSDWNFLGIALPHVPATDKAFSKELEEIHETLGNVLMYLAGAHEIGRASCRERVCQYGSIWVAAVSLKKKNK